MSDNALWGWVAEPASKQCLLWRNEQGRQPASVKFTWRRSSFQNAALGAAGHTR